MKQKYIEGTNKQYSIREDGVVIMHYFNYSDGRKISTYREIIGHSIKGKGGKYWEHYSCGKRVKKYSINKLLKTYFNINIPRINSMKVDVNGNRIRTKEYKIRKSITDRILVKKHVDEITESYVAHNLGLKKKDLPKNLYQLYKANLKLKRLIKSKIKANENKHTQLSGAHTCIV